MFSMLKNLTKVAVSVAVSPIALVTDIVTSPETGYTGKRPFRRTESVIDSAKDAFKAAVKQD